MDHRFMQIHTLGSINVYTKLDSTKVLLGNFTKSQKKRKKKTSSWALGNYIYTKGITSTLAWYQKIT